MDKIVDLGHLLVRLADRIDWGSLERRWGAAYEASPGQRPLAVRLVAGLFILKHMHDLSHEVLYERWVENPCYQYFCGEHVFRHELPFER